ncbi:MAG TPA: aspartate aminotransferase family protein [Caulobacteraceae bacterium]|nr:aspartate aminotransferase family protein [Caulobacteraceae bacterium]
MVEATPEFAGANSRRYPDEASRSALLHQRARAVMPSGNTRGTVFFKPYPVYAASGEGCRVTDVDGAERIDFVNNYSSLLHGHRPPEVMAAVRAQLDRIVAIGLPTEHEIALAELLVDRLAGVEQIRFANSGTEAVMLALKAARAFTGRPKIAKIEGAYHGGYDFAEVSQTAMPDAWGDPDRPNSTATSAGAPQSMLNEVVVLPWNDVDAACALIEAHAADLACVLVDPMPSRLCYAAIKPEFLLMLRETTAKIGALIVWDEVYNLRLGYNGAQGAYGLAPDLSALGKIIGGGFPVGAVGGKAEVMSVFAFDEGRAKVPHGGTYNGNPISMVAGLKTLQMMTPAAFERLNGLGDRLREGLKAALKDAGATGHVSGQGSFAMLTLTERRVENYRDLFQPGPFVERQAAVHRQLLNTGVLTSPALLFTLSTPMGDGEIEFVLGEVRAALGAL